MGKVVRWSIPPKNGAYSGNQRERDRRTDQHDRVIGGILHPPDSFEEEEKILKHQDSILTQNSCTSSVSSITIDENGTPISKPFMESNESKKEMTTASYPLPGTDLWDHNIKPSRKNKQIIISNIRHFKILFWLLAFGNLLMTTVFMSILYRVIFFAKNTFSISIIYPYVLPSCVVSIVVPTVHTIITCLRAINFSSKIRKRMYYVSCAVNVSHYVTLALALGTKLFLSLFKLKNKMFLELNSSLTSDITETFSVTQMTRKCCGVESYMDWAINNEPETSNEHELDTVKTLTFPDSCCPLIDEDDAACDLARVWRTGCYSMEYQWISWHVGWFLASLPLGFLLSAALSFQLRRLLRYYQTYRPFVDRAEIIDDDN